MMRYLCRLLLCTALLGVSSAIAQAEEDAVELRGFLQKAQEQGIATDPQWLALLHYESVFPSSAPLSRAAPSNFFLSDQGRKNPAAELEATIRAFIAPVNSEDDHAICRFPARFRWITEKLPLARESFPRPSCPRLTQWHEGVRADHVTLIFPASFLNNPASAFGHTFIRLDRAEQNEETRLLAYASDFSAATRGESALVYAFKGIFGGFDGFYSIMPYAKKVEKYSDLENRDIWEYQLGFTPNEVALLTLHLWELREIPFSYYYFDENCSYHILALLDVARPSLALASTLRHWIIPVDTIRTIAAHDGLVRHTVFRPSASTKLHERINRANQQEQTAALKIADTNQQISESVDTLSTPDEKIHALDLAYDYLTYNRIRSRSDDAQEKKRAWDILATRSSLPAGEPFTVETPAKRPEEGHKTALVALGGGRSEDRSYGEFTVRPAFHTLTDPLAGYLPGNQIKFFETTARYTEDRGVDLDRFTALDITALTPVSRFFKPVSWHVALSYQRFNQEGTDPLGLGALVAGGGKSLQVGDHVLLYAMADAEIEYAEALDNSHAAGLGPRTGAVYFPTTWASSEILFTKMFFVGGDDHDELSASLSQRISINADTNIRFEVNYQDAFSNSGWTSLVRIERFFSP